MLASEIVEKLQGYINLNGDAEVKLYTYNPATKTAFEHDATGVAISSKANSVNSESELYITILGNSQ